MKVSVIIPNYNHSRYLPKRIESVLEQTFRDFELIILDDCSTDDSRQVIEAYAKRSDKITCRFNEENSGNTFKQWNTGLALAQGDYIWVAESDDFAAPQLLEKLVEKLDAHQNVGIAYCQSWKVNEHDEFISSWKEWTDRLDAARWSQDFVNEGKDEVVKYLINDNTIPNASAALFRASTIKSLGNVDTDLNLNGDWLFYIKMLLVSDIAFVSEHYNFYRQHQQTVTSSTKKKAANKRNAVDLLLKLKQIFSEQEDMRLRALAKQIKILKKDVFIDWGCDVGIEYLRDREFRSAIKYLSLSLYYNNYDASHFLKIFYRHFKKKYFLKMNCI